MKPATTNALPDTTSFSTTLEVERRKLLTTRLWWILALAALAVGILITVLTVTGSTPGTHTPLEVFTGALTGGVQTAYMVTAMVGITAVAGEYRHRTVTPSYLAVPDRGKLIGAKLLISFIYGTVLGLVILAVCSAIAGPWLADRGLLNGSLEIVGITRAVIGGTLAIGIMTALGAAIAALIHNQMAAIGGLMIYLFAIEPRIANLDATKDLYPFLPGGAVQSLLYSGDKAFGSATGATLLAPWIGGMLLLAYAGAITAVAVRTTIRHDIT